MARHWSTGGARPPESPNPCMGRRVWCWIYSRGTSKRANFKRVRPIVTHSRDQYGIGERAVLVSRRNKAKASEQVTN